MREKEKKRRRRMLVVRTERNNKGQEGWSKINWKTYSKIIDRGAGRRGEKRQDKRS